MVVCNSDKIRLQCMVTHYLLTVDVCAYYITTLLSLLMMIHMTKEGKYREDLICQ